MAPSNDARAVTAAIAIAVTVKLPDNEHGHRRTTCIAIIERAAGHRARRCSRRLIVTRDQAMTHGSRSWRRAAKTM
jgi:hypothetical protein